MYINMHIYVLNLYASLKHTVLKDEPDQEAPNQQVLSADDISSDIIIIVCMFV